ncbi:MAG TPA: Dyp-type peroxidase [Acidobacteriaceae bacterium]|nr:Dyp-type peroxidase [Acidobacteriaceae bacterium]
MSRVILPLPLPRPACDLQPGVTDPVWPSTPPAGVDKTIYDEEYGGQLARQRYLHLVTANLDAAKIEVLQSALSSIAYFANHQMKKQPAVDDRRTYDPPVQNRRVTITLGLGSNLFTTPQGDDRFGLAKVRPKWLKILEPIAGDAPSFSPRSYSTDFLFLLASDDYYVNEYLMGLLYYGNIHPLIKVVSVERGYARPDAHEPSGFEDGSSNPRGSEPGSDMHRSVYIQHEDDEPGWCVGGTYLGYRKIQREMRSFFTLTEVEQEAIVGTHKKTGERLKDPPPCSHAFKLNPRRKTPDLMGILDQQRQILRRPYFYDDGVDKDGIELRGLHHLSFTRHLGTAYDWRIRMWQMNPDFPADRAGCDALYGRFGGAMNVGGGYYFIPSMREGRFQVGL